MAEKKERPIKVVAENRKARFNYAIEDSVEAGIVLTGTEVKSVRSGKTTIAESYADSKDGEIWLVNANIPEYAQANRFNHEPKRDRKLLLHKKQIDKLSGAIVSSMVADLIMPIIGAVTGGLDFSNYFTGLSKAVTAGNLADAKKQGAVLAWGNFLTIMLNFAIVAFVLFMVIRLMNRVKAKDEAAPAAPPKPTKDQELLSEIRDLLKKGGAPQTTASKSK